MKKNDIVMLKTDTRLGNTFRVLEVRTIDADPSNMEWAYLTPLRNGPNGMPAPVRTGELELVGDRVASSIKEELLALKRTPGVEATWRFRRGLIKGAVTSFSDLHDFMDANVLGDYESVLDLDVDPSVALSIQSNDNMTDAEAVVQTRLDILQAAQDEVDRWIKEGG